MRIGVPKESLPGDTRVAATPATVKRPIGLGYEELVELGAGERPPLDDAAYSKSGAKITSVADAWAAELVLDVNAPNGQGNRPAVRGAVRRTVGRLVPWYEAAIAVSCGRSARWGASCTSTRRRRSRPARRHGL